MVVESFGDGNGKCTPESLKKLLSLMFGDG